MVCTALIKDIALGSKEMLIFSICVAKLSKSGAAKALSAPASPVKPEPNAPKANSPVSTESDVQGKIHS